MKVVRATTLAEYQLVRTLRNSVASFMTNNASQISSAQQEVFYLKTRQDQNYKLYLFYEEHECFIGYGLLRRDCGRWYGSLAVVEEFRSQGYGTMIYKVLQDECTEDLWLEIFVDNNASIRAALKSGFNLVDIAKDKTVTLVYRKDEA